MNTGTRTLQDAELPHTPGLFGVVGQTHGAGAQEAAAKTGFVVRSAAAARPAVSVTLPTRPDVPLLPNIPCLASVPVVSVASVVSATSAVIRPISVFPTVLDIDTSEFPFTLFTPTAKSEPELFYDAPIPVLSPIPNTLSPVIPILSTQTTTSKPGHRYDAPTSVSPIVPNIHAPNVPVPFPTRTATLEPEHFYDACISVLPSVPNIHVPAVPALPSHTAKSKPEHFYDAPTPVSPTHPNTHAPASSVVLPIHTIKFESELFYDAPALVLPGVPSTHSPAVPALSTTTAKSKPGRLYSAPTPVPPTVPHTLASAVPVALSTQTAKSESEHFYDACTSVLPTVPKTHVSPIPAVSIQTELEPEHFYDAPTVPGIKTRAVSAALSNHILYNLRTEYFHDALSNAPLEFPETSVQRKLMHELPISEKPVTCWPTTVEWPLKGIHDTSGTKETFVFELPSARKSGHAVASHFLNVPDTLPTTEESARQASGISFPSSKEFVISTSCVSTTTESQDVSSLSREKSCSPHIPIYVPNLFFGNNLTLRSFSTQSENMESISRGMVLETEHLQIPATTKSIEEVDVSSATTATQTDTKTVATLSCTQVCENKILVSKNFATQTSSSTFQDPNKRTLETQTSIGDTLTKTPDTETENRMIDTKTCLTKPPSRVFFEQFDTNFIVSKSSDSKETVVISRSLSQTSEIIHTRSSILQREQQQTSFESSVTSTQTKFAGSANLGTAIRKLANIAKDCMHQFFTVSPAIIGSPVDDQLPTTSTKDWGSSKRSLRKELAESATRSVMRKHRTRRVTHAASRTRSVTSLSSSSQDGCLSRTSTSEYSSSSQSFSKLSQLPSSRSASPTTQSTSRLTTRVERRRNRKKFAMRHCSSEPPAKKPSTRQSHSAPLLPPCPTKRLLAVSAPNVRHCSFLLVRNPRRDSTTEHRTSHSPRATSRALLPSSYLGNQKHSTLNSRMAAETSRIEQTRQILFRRSRRMIWHLTNRSRAFRNRVRRTYFPNDDLGVTSESPMSLSELSMSSTSSHTSSPPLIPKSSHTSSLSQTPPPPYSLSHRPSHTPSSTYSSLSSSSTSSSHSQSPSRLPSPSHLSSPSRSPSSPHAPLHTKSTSYPPQSSLTPSISHTLQPPNSQTPSHSPSHTPSHSTQSSCTPPPFASCQGRRSDFYIHLPCGSVSPIWWLLDCGSKDSCSISGHPCDRKRRPSYSVKTRHLPKPKAQRRCGATPPHFRSPRSAAARSSGKGESGEGASGAREGSASAGERKGASSADGTKTSSIAYLSSSVSMSSTVTVTKMTDISEESDCFENVITELLAPQTSNNDFYPFRMDQTVSDILSKENTTFVMDNLACPYVTQILQSKEFSEGNIDSYSFPEGTECDENVTTLVPDSKSKEALQAEKEQCEKLITSECRHETNETSQNVTDDPLRTIQSVMGESARALYDEDGERLVCHMESNSFQNENQSLGVHLSTSMIAERIESESSLSQSDDASRRKRGARAREAAAPTDREEEAQTAKEGGPAQSTRRPRSLTPCARRLTHGTPEVRPRSRPPSKSPSSRDSSMTPGSWRTSDTAHAEETRDPPPASAAVDPAVVPDAAAAPAPVLTPPMQTTVDAPVSIPCLGDVTDALLSAPEALTMAGDSLPQVPTSEAEFTSMAATLFIPCTMVYDPPQVHHEAPVSTTVESYFVEVNSESTVPPAVGPFAPTCSVSLPSTRMTGIAPQPVSTHKANSIPSDSKKTETYSPLLVSKPVTRRPLSSTPTTVQSRRETTSAPTSLEMMEESLPRARTPPSRPSLISNHISRPTPVSPSGTNPMLLPIHEITRSLSLLRSPCRPAPRSRSHHLSRTSDEVSSRLSTQITNLSDCVSSPKQQSSSSSTSPYSFVHTPASRFTSASDTKQPSPKKTDIPSPRHQSVPSSGHRSTSSSKRFAEYLKHVQIDFLGREMATSSKAPFTLRSLSPSSDTSKSVSPVKEKTLLYKEQIHAQKQASVAITTAFPTGRRNETSSMQSDYAFTVNSKPPPRFQLKSPARGGLVQAPRSARSGDQTGFQRKPQANISYATQPTSSTKLPSAKWKFRTPTKTLTSPPASQSPLSVRANQALSRRMRISEWIGSQFPHSRSLSSSLRSKSSYITSRALRLKSAASQKASSASSSRKHTRIPLKNACALEIYSSDLNSTSTTRRVRPATVPASASALAKVMRRRLQSFDSNQVSSTVSTSSRVSKVNSPSRPSSHACDVTPRVAKHSPSRELSLSRTKAMHKAGESSDSSSSLSCDKMVQRLLNDAIGSLCKLMEAGVIDEKKTVDATASVALAMSAARSALDSGTPAIETDQNTEKPESPRPRRKTFAYRPFDKLREHREERAGSGVRKQLVADRSRLRTSSPPGTPHASSSASVDPKVRGAPATLSEKRTSSPSDKTLEAVKISHFTDESQRTLPFEWIAWECVPQSEKSSDVILASEDQPFPQSSGSLRPSEREKRRPDQRVDSHKKSICFKSREQLETCPMDESLKGSTDDKCEFDIQYLRSRAETSKRFSAAKKENKHNLSEHSTMDSSKPNPAAESELKRKTRKGAMQRINKNVKIPELRMDVRVENDHAGSQKSGFKKLKDNCEVQMEESLKREIDSLPKSQCREEKQARDETAEEDKESEDAGKSLPSRAAEEKIDTESPLSHSHASPFPHKSSFIQMPENMQPMESSHLLSSDALYPKESETRAGSVSTVFKPQGTPHGNFPHYRHLLETTDVPSLILDSDPRHNVGPSHDTALLSCSQKSRDPKKQTTEKLPGISSSGTLAPMEIVCKTQKHMAQFLERWHRRLEGEIKGIQHELAKRNYPLVHKPTESQKYDSSQEANLSSSSAAENTADEAGGAPPQCIATRIVENTHRNVTGEAPVMETSPDGETTRERREGAKEKPQCTRRVSIETRKKFIPATGSEVAPAADSVGAPTFADAPAPAEIAPIHSDSFVSCISSVASRLEDKKPEAAFHAVQQHSKRLLEKKLLPAGSRNQAAETGANAGAGSPEAARRVPSLSALLAPQSACRSAPSTPSHVSLGHSDGATDLTCDDACLDRLYAPDRTARRHRSAEALTAPAQGKRSSQEGIALKRSSSLEPVRARAQRPSASLAATPAEQFYATLTRLLQAPSNSSQEAP